MNDLLRKMFAKGLVLQPEWQTIRSITEIQNGESVIIVTDFSIYQARSHHEVDFTVVLLAQVAQW